MICFAMLTMMVSCTPKRIEIPTYEGMDPLTVLAKNDNVSSIQTTFSIEYDRDGRIMKGDAALRMTPEALNLYVYSLGFLVAEITSDNNTVKSRPPLEKNKLEILVDGLRSSFFWWSIKDPDIRDYRDSYYIFNSWKKLLVDKKTMMPEKQLVELDGNRELSVLYKNPDLIDGIWFPSEMQISLSRYSVRLKVKTLSFN